MINQGRVDGIGDGKILSPYYRRREEEALKAIEERKQELLAHLEETNDPEEKRAIGEELANLPTVIRMMAAGPEPAQPGRD
jgi:hypothetical protein